MDTIMQFLLYVLGLPPVVKSGNLGELVQYIVGAVICIVLFVGIINLFFNFLKSFSKR